MALEGYGIDAAVKYHYGQFPPRYLDYQKLIRPLSAAAAEIARYDATMRTLPNSELLLAPLRSREAVISSRMEGTVASIDDVLKFEAEDGDRDKGAFGAYGSEIIEVWSYTRALNKAQALFSEGLPLSGRLIKDAHRQMLWIGRGADKQPGEFKREQNYIVDRARKQVLFIPASPDRFDDLFAVLETYINSEDHEPLLQVALSHIEFEALHPFKDGNGRIGRMLVTLMLWSRGLITSPHFYISAQLEKEKDEYLDRMRAVSERGEWTEWCVFFLEALAVQARENVEKANQILGLYNEMKDVFRDRLASQWAVHALDYVFNKPVFRNSAFTGGSGIPRQTASRLSAALVENGLLRVVEPAAGSRAALLAFEPLLELVRD